jgi:hypothetical protein
MSNPEAIKAAQEKIKKLLAFSEGNHNSEDEAANAMRIAAGLAARYGIELESLRPETEEKPKVAEKAYRTEMKPYEALCAKAAAVLYGVECIAPNYGKRGFWFTGRDDNITMAEQTHLWLVRQVEALYKIALPRGLTKQARSQFRNSFKDACAERLYQRAYHLMLKLQQDEQVAKETTGSTALVVAGHFKMLEAEIREFNHNKYHAPAIEQQKRIKERRENMLAAMTEADRVKFLENEEKERIRAEKKARPYKAPRTRNLRRGSGTEAGWAAGERVQLRQELK